MILYFIQKTVKFSLVLLSMFILFQFTLAINGYSLVDFFYSHKVNSSDAEFDVVHEGEYRLKVYLKNENADYSDLIIYRDGKEYSTLKIDEFKKSNKSLYSFDLFLFEGSYHILNDGLAGVNYVFVRAKNITSYLHNVLKTLDLSFYIYFLVYLSFLSFAYLVFFGLSLLKG